MAHLHERRYNHGIDRLRNPKRLAMLEVNRVIQLLLENLPQATGFLDIGTGSGVFAQKLAAPGLSVTAIDVSRPMLQTAKSYVPDAALNQAIAENLPFKNESFDVVFMGLVFHETDDRLTAMQEAYRVSRQRTAVLEWSYENLEVGPPLSDRVSPEQLTGHAHTAGFKQIETIHLENLVLYRLEKNKK